MPQHVTLRQIALAAGCHHTTVGMALRNDPRISPDTAARIKDIAKKLGYHSNPYLSAWMASVRQANAEKFKANIAYIDLYSKDDPLTPRFYKGVQERSAELGYCTQMLRPRIDKLKSSRINQILESSGTRGIILGPSASSHGHISLNWNHFAAVRIGYSLLKPDINRVCSNQYEVMQLALRQTKKMGFRRVGFIQKSDIDIRTNGLYSAAFLWYQQSVEKKNRIPILAIPSITPQLVTKWYHKYRPDCVVCLLSNVRHYVQNASNGMAEFICIDHFSTDFEFPGVNQNYEAVGRAAMDVVASDIALNQVGIPKNYITILVKEFWVPASGEPISHGGAA